MRNTNSSATKRAPASIDCTTKAPGSFGPEKPLNILGRWFHKIAKGKGWWKGSAGRVEKKILLMHSELSEMTEELRDGRSQTEVYYKKDKHGQWKPEGVPIEAADLYIRLGDYCARHQIDLDRAVEIKMAFNLGRPYLHGGKAF